MIKEKVVEILVLIMSEMEDNKRISEIDMEALRERGYSTSEISAAFTWLYEHVAPGSSRFRPTERTQEGSRRMFHEAERAALSPTSQGYLIQLVEMGILDGSSLELIIERVMMAGEEQIPHEDVQNIAASVILSAAPQGTLSSVSLFNNGETIH
jgi:uncharacterized protein Smg (DUF494 family)